MILLGSVQRAELQLLLDDQIGDERRLLPPDETSERNTPSATSPAVIRRNRSSTNILDDLPNLSGLEQVWRTMETRGTMAGYLSFDGHGREIHRKASFGDFV